MVAEATGPLGFEPSVRMDGPLDSAVPDELRPDLLATLREALSNVVKHANATEATVTVAVSPSSGLCRLEVTDNGDGMPKTGKRRSGLANLAERARRWHGKCDVESAPNAGTTVRWVVSLSRLG